MLPTRSSQLAVLLLSLFATAGLSAGHAAGDGWPEGYEIAEKSESPDGHYGVLLPSRLVADALDDEKIVNILVNLKTHARLCVIRGAHYFPGKNHWGLTVAWAADSSWCAVTYGARYGFDTITLVEPHGGKCTQNDLGGHIQKALNAVIEQQAHAKDAGGEASAFFRSGPGRQVVVRGTAQTNPKSLEGQPTYCAMFEGTFDLTTGKWTRSEARKVTSEEMDGLDTVFGSYSQTPEEEGITFVTEEDRLKYYDDRLNGVYRAIRVLLPAERFTAVKKEQIAWLKQLESKPSAAAKCEFMAARIKELQALVW